MHFPCRRLCGRLCHGGGNCQDNYPQKGEVNLKRKKRRENTAQGGVVGMGLAESIFRACKVLDVTVEELDEATPRAELVSATLSSMKAKDDCGENV